MTQCICRRRDADVLQIKLLTQNLFVIFTIRQKVEKQLEQMLAELKLSSANKTVLDISKKIRKKYCCSTVQIKGDFFRLTRTQIISQIKTLVFSNKCSNPAHSYCPLFILLTIKFMLMHADQNANDIRRCSKQPSDHIDRFIASLLDLLPPTYFTIEPNNGMSPLEMIQYAR